ncbi:MAG: stage II sporulation protein R [Bacillota bacterium]
MKTKVRALALLIAILIVTALCLEAKAQSILRLHVIANSDSATDQAIKLEVRDALLAAEGGALKDCGSAQQAKQILLQSGDRMLAAAEAVLKKHSAPYGVQLMIGEFEFPEKSYGAKVYPAGEYQALRVILGAGEGQNWWCVMFPPLCVIDLDKADREKLEKYKGSIRFKSVILELIEKWFAGGKA